MARLRGSYRYQLQLQLPDGDRLREIVSRAGDGLKPPDGVSWTVDIDPLDML